MVALLAGAGVAMAATSGSPTSGAAAVSPAGGVAATPSPSARPAFPHQGRPGGLGFGFGAPFGAVHGQFVVPKSGGGYQTIDTQRGSVTAVSATSITVKSADGFTMTYQVVSSTNVDAQRDGIGTVKTGHQVAVAATVSGGTATAVSILDFTLLPSMHGGPGWNHPAPPSAPPARGWAKGQASGPRSGLGQGPDRGSDTSLENRARDPRARFVGPAGENLIRAGRRRHRARGQLLAVRAGGRRHRPRSFRSA